MADPFRRAGGDHVARQERREVRAEGDDLRHRIDQEIGAGLLHLLSVQPRREREAGRIRNLVGGDDPGPERTGGGEILSRSHGEFLIVAHAAVDEAGVTGDVVERAPDWDMATAATDHNCKLAFEVEALRHRGADHLALVAGERVGEPDEHARLFWQFAPGLGGMGTLIDAGAENLVRVRDHGSHLTSARWWSGLAAPATFLISASPPAVSASRKVA